MEGASGNQVDSKDRSTRQSANRHVAAAAVYQLLPAEAWCVSQQGINRREMPGQEELIGELLWTDICVNKRAYVPVEIMNPVAIYELLLT